MQILLASYAVFIFLLAGIAFGQELPKLRNVLVIVSDDHARHVTGAYGNDIINTPNIDRLAVQGVTFTQAYCNAPICSASRQSLLTGKYPRATGVNLLFTPFPDEDNTTIAEHLEAYSYQSALIGKNHFNNWVGIRSIKVVCHSMDSTLWFRVSSTENFLKNKICPNCLRIPNFMILKRQKKLLQN